jgi:dienelactone hydrolase
MTSVALFHSVLGVRPGVNAAADLLRSHGHDVTVVDQYEGRVFDNYDDAGAFATNIGYPALMQSAAHAVEDIRGSFVCAGFSNGGGMSMYVAANNPAVHA